MASLRRCLLALLAGFTLLPAAGGPGSSHSLRNCHMAVSDPDLGMPQFIAVGYVDDELIIHYDSHTRRMRPVAVWMRNVEQDSPSFWDEESQVLQGDEKFYKEILEKLMELINHNSSSGIHTLQAMLICKIGPDEQPKEQSWMFAYDGEVLLAFNPETDSWEVFRPEAEILRQKLGTPENVKISLDKTCGELQNYLVYGKETLQRKESPEVRVTLKKGENDQETLNCRVYGFYPKKINVTWMKDGEGQKPDNFTKNMILPNSDGTYHTWRSITVDPKDRGNYSCQVEHDSLPKSLELVWKEPTSNSGLIISICRILLALIVYIKSNLGIIIGISAGVLLVVIIILGLIVYFIPWHVPGHISKRWQRAKDRFLFASKKPRMAEMRRLEGVNVSAQRDTDKLPDCSIKGDSGQVSSCSDDENSDQESKHYSDGDSGFQLGDRKNSQSSQMSYFQDGRDTCSRHEAAGPVVTEVLVIPLLEDGNIHPPPVI